MKYLILLYTSILFSQNIKKDTLFVYAYKTDWNKNESWNKKSCNIVEFTLKNYNHFDSLVFTLEKSNKQLKKYINKNNTILFKDFITDETNFFNQIEKHIVFIIYDKKNFIK